MGQEGGWEVLMDGRHRRAHCPLEPQFPTEVTEPLCPARGLGKPPTMHCQIGLFVVGVCLLSRGQGSEVGGGYRRTKKAGEHMFGEGCVRLFQRQSATDGGSSTLTKSRGEPLVKSALY